MIDIYLLEQLDAFASHGTLSEAADYLHMTQPTLTRSMQKLEDYFGFPLFQRQKKRLILNDTGKMLAEYAGKILEQERDMEAHVRNYHKSLNTLRIGSIAPGPLYTLLPECTSRFPDITIASTVETEEAVIRGIKNDEYGIILLTHPLEEEGYFSREYMSEHLNLSVNVMHPASARKSISFAEMNGQNFLMFNQVGIWENIVKTQMPDSNFYKQESFEALNELVTFSDLPSFTTDVTLSRFGRNDSQRVSIPFSDQSARITYYVICKNSLKARWLDKLPVTK